MARSVLAWIVVAGLAVGLAVAAVVYARRMATADSKAVDFPSSASLSPSRPPPAKATLKLGAVDIPVEVKTYQAGSRYNVALESNGTTCETEGYVSTDGSFALADAAGETYDPPLPLLKFPLRVGDAWDWNGTTESGGEANKARARISTYSEQQYIGGDAVEAVRVRVSLTVTNDAGWEVGRELTFWFGQDTGLFRRQFGSGSERKAEGQ